MESHADTLATFSFYLTSILGHSVTTARSVSEALTLWPQSPHDVLISELWFPDGDGCELLARLRSPRWFYALAITSLGTAADRARSQAAGFHRHLLKPFKVAQLDAVLEEAAQQLAARSQRADQPEAA